MEYHKYLSVVTISRKKNNKANVRTNSHELHIENERWSIPKTLGAEKVCHLCESLSVEDENHSLILRANTKK